MTPNQPPGFLKPLLLLLLLAAGMPCAGAQTYSPPTGHPLLIVSIDGLMPEQLRRSDTPHIDRLAKEGAVAESLIPAFPPKTFPAHHSIATGLYVENHGVIANTFYDHSLGRQFRFGAPSGSSSGEIWWGGEPIWVTAQNQSLNAAMLFWPGSDQPINAVLPARYKPYDASMPNRARVDTVVSWLDRNGEIRADLASLYFSEVDHYGHRFGPFSEEALGKVAEADELIGYLLTRLEQVGLTGRVNLLLISDHGMMELSEERLIFLDELIDLNSVDVIDWSPVAMLRPKEGRKRELFEELKRREDGYRVYLKEELPEALRFRNHYRIPDIILIADPGYTVTSRPFFEQRGIPAGMHGYDPRHPEMHGILLASGPAFAEGVEIGPVESVHLYELMCHVLALKPAPNDGSPDVLAPLLR